MHGSSRANLASVVKRIGWRRMTCLEGTWGSKIFADRYRGGPVEVRESVKEGDSKEGGLKALVAGVLAKMSERERERERAIWWKPETCKNQKWPRCPMAR
jgi:hypothetical protein